MLKKLRQRKADAIARMQAILKASDTGDRDLTDAERTEYDGLRASVDTLNGDITRAEAMQEQDRNAPASAVVQVGDDRAAQKPYRSFGEQLKVIAKGTQLIRGGRQHQIDPRLQAALGASETVPSDGGFLVEPEYSKDLMQRIYNTGEIAKRCRDFQMASARTIVPAVDEDSRVDGQRWGGLLSYWLAEAQSYTGTKPKFREIQLVANKLIGLMYATEELLEDESLLKSYADEIVPQEFAFQIDQAIIGGSGAGQPLGILNSPATLTVPYSSGEGSSGTPPSTTDILNMWSRMWGPYRKNAIWLINQSIEPGLYPLTLGSPSLAQYLIYTPPGVNGNQSGYGLLFGRPVIPVEQSLAVGTAGDIVLFSPDGYLPAKKNEMRADSSIHVAFLTGEVAFRFMVRLDGQPWWKKPLQPYYPTGGTAPPTLAPFVVLETRQSNERAPGGKSVRLCSLTFAPALGRERILIMPAKGFWVGQDGHLALLIPPQSAGAAVVGARFSLAEWAHASILLILGAAGGPAGAITVDVYEAETGGSGVAIPYRLIKFENGSAPYDVAANNSATNNSIFYETAAGYTPPDDANSMYIIEVDAADVLAAANGTYIGLNIAVGSLGTTAQLLAAVAVLSAGRNTSDQSLTVQQ